MSRSFDGGRTFDQPRAVAVTGSVGVFDPVQGDVAFDGVAGARTGVGPAFDIANGAPSGVGAPNTLVLGWDDGQNGLNHERAMIQLSTNRGVTWGPPVNATEAGDRPDFPWVAISPDGTDLYLVYMAFLSPFQTSLSNPRWMQGVVRHADTATPSTWATLQRGPKGDARGSSANALNSEFLGDYNYVAATNDFAMAVWNDVRNAADCPAIDVWRASLVAGAPIAQPAPPTDCPATFGNSDIFGFRAADPTP
jgi:hypothetical protein